MRLEADLQHTDFTETQNHVPFPGLRLVEMRLAKSERPTHVLLPRALHAFRIGVHTLSCKQVTASQPSSSTGLCWVVKRKTKRAKSETYPSVPQYFHLDVIYLVT